MKSLIFSLFLAALSMHSALAEITHAEHLKRMKKMTVQGMEIAYVDEGSGPVVVLIHGIPTSSWMYRKIIPLLVAQGRRVIAPDLLGFGESQRTNNREQISVPGQAKILMDLLSDKLGLTNWTHVVHDFGGPISWEMMEDERFHAEKLVILDTFAFEDGWNPGMNLFMRGLTTAGTTLPGVKKIFFHEAFKGMVATPGTATKEMLSGYCSPMMNGGSKSYRRLLFSVNNLRNELPRYQRTLSRLQIPVVILWGEKDDFLSAKLQMPRFKELLRVSDEDAIVLKGTKHLITEERPEIIAKKILN